MYDKNSHAQVFYTNVANRETKWIEGKMIMVRRTKKEQTNIIAGFMSWENHQHENEWKRIRLSNAQGTTARDKTRRQTQNEEKKIRSH